LEKIALEIIALSQNVSQTHSYAIVLGEVGGSRRLPIVIGGFEAQAIAVALEKMTPSRPLTHDLMKNIFYNFDIELEEVLIDNLQEGVFFSKLICQRNGQSVEIDSRTSDAIALAVRFGCPIYSYEFILEQAGIVMEEKATPTEEAGKKAAGTSKGKTTSKKEDLSSLSMEELNEKLQGYLDHEAYEKAAAVRDELQKRANP
jgi:bifunctional DNase/RNase